MRKVFNQLASEIIKNDEKAVLILGDIGVYGFREILANYKKRAFNIGILEQSMVSVGAGMALEGMVPIIHTIAPFIVERALEQIKVDFGYQNLPGNMVSVGASFDYSKLGCTHHCPADIPILSHVPGLNLFIPGHKDEFKSQFENNWDKGSLNYFRLTETENKDSLDLELGEIKKIKYGDKGVIIAVGPIFQEVVLAIMDLDVELHYVNSIPAQGEMEINSEFLQKKVMIIEPYYSGTLLLKLIGQLSSTGCEINQVGVPKAFLENYGTYSEQLGFIQLDSNSIRNRVESFFGI
jgi:transketolase